MSIRLIDEIYDALHNNEKPPYTNARGPYKNSYGLSLSDALKKYKSDTDAFFVDENYDFDTTVKYKVTTKFDLFFLPPFLKLYKLEDNEIIADSPPLPPSSESEPPSSD